ncbi:MAG: c-type cytochrome domain-containing protein, partial [Limisphaerales bacterium]
MSFRLQFSVLSLLIGFSAVAREHDPIPILLRRCTICHGGEYQDAGLDLRTIAAIRKGSTNGPVILVGDAEGSLLIQKIVSDEMPP